VPTPSIMSSHFPRVWGAEVSAGTQRLSLAISSLYQAFGVQAFPIAKRFRKIPRWIGLVHIDLDSLKYRHFDGRDKCRAADGSYRHRGFHTTARKTP